MIGNDIVDINFTRKQSNWQRDGFLDKIFTSEEQEHILESKCSFTSVWQLWSMKESVYKIYVRKYKERFFAPKKLVCTLTDSSNGSVIINDEKYFSKTITNKKYIYSTAISGVSNLSSVDTFCFPLKEGGFSTQRATVYSQLKNRIAEKYNLNSKIIQIEKTALGIPEVKVNNQTLGVNISLTHHGNYGAVSILNLNS
ncbi:4'-phosphopantetheinyl transferase superfamily protein [uncultured Tenacibaculum sp.]|uniref:4'-phosphopantetheinyl transferase family protein n=1 Tax=uncultured Tenacibaculum sp. TaxID=174713 RepID=UPI0026115E3D|nr:4'-phosphopantetheinyl transferase superfamily protein [uncultured Tenacibaculum sp.]